MKARIVRQASFRDDGSQTDIPVLNQEQPQLEKQADLFQYARDQENLRRLQPEPNSLLAGLAQSIADKTGKVIHIDPAGITAEPKGE